MVIGLCGDSIPSCCFQLLIADSFAEESSRHNMSQQDSLEGLCVFQKWGNHILRDFTKSFIGWCKHCEWAFTGKGICKPCLDHKRDEGGESLISRGNFSNVARGSVSEHL